MAVSRLLLAISLGLGLGGCVELTPQQMQAIFDRNGIRAWTVTQTRTSGNSWRVEVLDNRRWIGNRYCAATHHTFFVSTPAAEPVVALHDKEMELSLYPCTSAEAGSFAVIRTQIDETNLVAALEAVSSLAATGKPPEGVTVTWNNATPALLAAHVVPRDFNSLGLDYDGRLSLEFWTDRSSDPLWLDFRVTFASGRVETIDVRETGGVE